MHICKFCGKEFNNPQQLGGHMVFCRKNPKYIEVQSKIRNRKNTKEQYELTCTICGEKYVLTLTEKAFNNGKYRKTCCTKCAHILANKNADKDVKNYKISTSLKGIIYPDKRTQRFCLECNSPISFERNRSKFCCEKCMKIHRYNTLSKNAISRGLGGLVPSRSHKFYKKGYYHGIWCDSSWELAYILYLKDHNIQVDRNFDSKVYIPTI